MTEQKDAIKLANRILERPYADPDDDLAVLARQLLRSREIIDKQEKALQEVDWNGQAELGLIHANRDALLRMHETAITRIRKIVDRYRQEGNVFVAIGAMDCMLIHQIIRALGLFHPMHCEGWCGWPEGSE